MSGQRHTHKKKDFETMIPIHFLACNYKKKLSYMCCVYTSSSLNSIILVDVHGWHVGWILQFWLVWGQVWPETLPHAGCHVPHNR